MLTDYVMEGIMKTVCAKGIVYIVLGLLLLGLLFPAVSLQAEAASIYDSGSCGTKLKWVLDTDGTLTISGSGAMTSSPWSSYTGRVNKVVMTGGTSIYASACKGMSNMTQVTIADTVTAIGKSAFSDCTALQSITIPKKVSTIGEDAFYKCTNLTEIQVAAANTSFSSENGVLFDKNRTSLLTYPAGRVGAYRIPDGVTEIGNSAFVYASGLTDVEFPDSLKVIGEYAFAWSGIASNVVLPDSVTTVGEEAFYYCNAMTSLTLSGGMTEISGYLAASCDNLQTVIIPDSVTTIGEYAFWGCPNLVSLQMSRNLTTIGKRAFWSCTRLDDPTLPEGLTGIGAYAFASCSGKDQSSHKRCCNQALPKSRLFHLYTPHKFLNTLLLVGRL